MKKQKFSPTAPMIDRYPVHKYIFTYVENQIMNTVMIMLMMTIIIS